MARRPRVPARLSKQGLRGFSQMLRVRKVRAGGAWVAQLLSTGPLVLAQVVISGLSPQMGSTLGRESA